ERVDRHGPPGTVPGLREPVWVSPGTGAGGTGDGPGGSVAVDPFVSLRRDLVSNTDRRILTYETDAATPGYLRLLTLDQFDGVTWTASQPQVRIPASEALDFPDSPDVRDVRESTYSIGIADLDNAALPVPYAATVIRGTDGPLDDRWAWDPLTRTVAGDGVTSRDASYEVTAYEIAPTRAELRAAEASPTEEPPALLQLPPGITPRLAELAQEVTADAKTPYARAMALMRWFTRDGGFRYSTNVVTPPGADPLDSFLTERVGYCQQFAGTMALMARSVGIPARVSVGFTAGREAEDGTWEVQARNAHAWPELWFPGVGWVWFEPTPRTDAGAGVRAPSYTQPREDDDEADTGDAATRDRPVRPDLLDEGSSAAAAAPRDAGLPVVVIAVVAALLAAALVAPVLAVLARRRRRTSSSDPRRRIEGAWAELGDSTRDFGLPWPAAGTPRALGARPRARAGLDDDEVAAVERLVGWVEGARYAAPAAGATAAPSAADLRADLAVIRGGLRRNATRRERLRAVLVPRSLTGSGQDSAFLDDDAAEEAPDRQTLPV
ncbi:MAG: transglutaminaseTgpA domain-containing protein, partial [bacterium]